ncbi:MAG: histidine phosphatase family protein [Erysipelotrichaceae bacterium]|nr:histidine phosphatase family protein [Erysipelotrichaceae bacterium]
MLYLMRHGKTSWNINRRYQGNTDIPLCDEGILQAKEAKEKYKDVHFDICYTSPLSRARKTAEIVLEGRDIQIITDERLREMNFGEYEGRYVNKDDKDDPMTILFDSPEKFVPGIGGERLEDVIKRTGSFLEECVYPYKDRDILLIGHGAMFSGLYCSIFDIPVENYWQHFTKNCELVKVEYQV